MRLGAGSPGPFAAPTEPGYLGYDMKDTVNKPIPVPPPLPGQEPAAAEPVAAEAADGPEEEVEIPVEVAEAPEQAVVDAAEAAEPQGRDETPTVPILIPKVYADAHVRDSDRPTQPAPPPPAGSSALDSLDVAAPVIPGPPPLPAEVEPGRRDRPRLATPSTPRGSGASASSSAPTEVRRRTAAQQPAESARGKRAVPLALVALAAVAAVAIFVKRPGQSEQKASASAEAGAVAAAARPEPAAVPLPEPAPVPVKVTREVEPQPEPPTEAVAPADTLAPAPAAAPKKATKRRVARKRKAAAPLDPATLPEEPSRADIVRAMASVKGEVARCTEGRRGVAELEITIAKTGRIRHAVVGGQFKGTTAGSCIARAVRKAKVAPFKKDTYRVLYPFAI